VDVALLAALAEPNRLRIVELLDAAPRPVGEIAMKLELRQPQVTKHLQTLERAGLVTMHPLGQRRIYALHRERFAELREWSDALAREHDSERLLEPYQAAVERELAQARRDPGWAVGRTIRLTRELSASVDTVWSYWTTESLVRGWWSPEHFTVTDCEVDAVVGGRLRVVMQEGDGTRHPGQGRFLAVRRPDRLSFEFGPLAPDGSRLLSAVHDLALAGDRERTRLALEVRITHSTAQAAPAVAGLELGWHQLLGKLARVLG
jgi:uncharacterized protein YndB with AHSA1/START domain/DNA-binding MarR family transcriptional regulator